MVAHAITTCQLKIIWNLIQEHLEDNCNFSRAEKRALSHSKYGGGGGGTPDVKWQGWSKDFLGNFQFRDLFKCENFRKYFLASLIYVEILLGIQKYLKIYDCYII